MELFLLISSTLWCKLAIEEFKLDFSDDTFSLNKRLEKYLQIISDFYHLIHAYDIAIQRIVHTSKLTTPVLDFETITNSLVKLVQAERINK